MNKPSVSVINSPTPVVKQSTPPVIVVGLPRSGSSYLSHVLSCMDEWFVFDDLYPYQIATGYGIPASLNLAENEHLLKKFVNRMTWQLRAKIKYENNFYFPDISLDDTYEMEERIFEALQNRETFFWSDALEEWLTRLAAYCGKHRWGYKTPQDFMHMEQLAKIFPGVKFIYILRDPRKVLQSFKSLPRVKTHGSQDGVSRQYHPFVYSLYWKKAYETTHAFIEKGQAPVEVVRFEDLVRDPVATADRLAKFLGTTVVGDVSVAQSNSSSHQGSRRELTNTEIRICEAIAGACMEKAGYKTSLPTPKIFDVFDLLDTSFTFTLYQLEQIIKDKGKRASIATFIKKVFRQ